ncbi:MATE family efflux transporter [Halococcoides cellulosivorans]|uniref:Multidrug-efflux transporter n=1 Tax=Halococcoides cellulosivorans TaxID=1679096 RepID=A0A2R4X2Q2_9EURY|nr:MATE family efflux transporter [Halococcoides cellulosivorans]AWB28078.1 MATE family efflux transporter [Halococcoides cellulosivorans]
MYRYANPVWLAIHLVGRALSRLGLIDAHRARRTTDLAWPRVVTGIARMSKNAADAAMVGIGVGSLAINGLGYAGPYWGLTFAVGGGLASGTIALVSQRFGADDPEALGEAVRASAVTVLVATIPLALVFGLFARPLIAVLGSDPTTIAYGASYLRVVALGVPFAGLSLIASRVLIGANDARTPMLIRTAGATLNVGLNAVLIFGLGPAPALGVVGAAGATVLANALVATTFAVGIALGWLPLIGALPVQVSPRGRYLLVGTIHDIVSIGTPAVGRNATWTVARFPMLAIVTLFGPATLTAYVVARRIWGLLNTPGWGFGLAASSLVGQHLGTDEEEQAAAYGREITIFSVGTYVVAAGLVALFARPIVGLFVERGDPAIPIAVALVYAACLAIVPQGVASAIAGALDATGDTVWPFISKAIGTIVVALPLAYLGAITPLGVLGLYLAFLAETVIPAAINYSRFATGKWRAISRQYRPD